MKTQDSQYQIIDDRFHELIIANASIVRLSTGHLWTEGPVWIHDQNVLLFSDIPNQQILRWTTCGSVTVFREPSLFSNGHTRDLQGRLISCLHGTRSIVRTEHDGSLKTLCKKYNGYPLNSPNDVVVKSDGTIWFTDPTYGILSNYEGYKAESEQDHNYVFCLEPESGSLMAVTKGFSQPNGLAFSVDEKTLYIAESGRSHDSNVSPVVKVFDVSEGNDLSNERVFAAIDPGIPDGLRVDSHDNVWISAADGVHCFDREGKLIGKIFVPETVSNIAFGGARGNQLFITATSSVYSIYVNTAPANKNR